MLSDTQCYHILKFHLQNIAKLISLDIFIIWLILSLWLDPKWLHFMYYCIYCIINWSQTSAWIMKKFQRQILFHRIGSQSDMDQHCKRPRQNCPPWKERKNSEKSKFFSSSKLPRIFMLKNFLCTRIPLWAIVSWIYGHK